LAFGVPSVIDQATIRPAAGATNSLRLPSIRVWNAVVREMTSQGLLGQLGAGAASTSPISMILAEAAPGRTSAAASAARKSRLKVPCMPALNTSDRSRLLSGRWRRRSTAPRARQTFCTLTAFGPFSPFSSS
jgi:hypothetical protein